MFVEERFCLLSGSKELIPPEDPGCLCKGRDHQTVPGSQDLFVCGQAGPFFSVKIKGPFHPFQTLGVIREWRLLEQIRDAFAFKISPVRNIIEGAEKAAVFFSQNVKDFISGKSIVFSFFSFAVSVLAAVKASIGMRKFIQDAGYDGVGDFREERILTARVSFRICL